MGRMYAVNQGPTAFAAEFDLYEITAPTDAVVVVHSIEIGQSSDAGDAEAEMLEVSLRLATVAGSGGFSGNDTPLQAGSPAFGGVADVENSTVATAAVQYERYTFNIQAGWLYRPTPEERIVVSPGAIFVVRVSAPADSLTFNSTFTFEEIGG